MTRVLATSLLLAVSVANVSQAQPQKTQINKIPAPYTSPTSGEEMYRSYCAACHGINARGSGPAAPALKAVPSDLTILSKKNGGNFPASHVSNVIRGDERVYAHGSADMPVWGNIFRSIGGDPTVTLRINNLSNYLKSLQQK